MKRIATPMIGGVITSAVLNLLIYPVIYVIDAQNVKLELNMNMPGMVMHSGAKISREHEPGSYQAHLTPDMAGDWSADLSYQGPQGPSKLTLPLNVRQ